MKFDEAKEIFGLLPDFDPNHVEPVKLEAKRGPSRWGDKDLQFGPEEDYELYFARDIDKWVFWPRSEAGREWAYYVFPEDAPRYSTGFILDNPKFARIIRLAAERDRLMSLSEYEEAMNEAQEVMRQEGRDD